MGVRALHECPLIAKGAMNGAPGFWRDVELRWCEGGIVRGARPG